MSTAPLIWDDLQFFLAVARAGQLSRAARALRTSHVTVGRRIDRIEAALKTRLFERAPRGYTLTASGERLVAVAERIEQEADRLREQVLGGGSLHGSIRLNMPEGLSSFFCAEILPEFTGRFPALSLELVSIQQVLSLSRKVTDLAILLDPPKGGPYWTEKLSDYSLGLYASPDYLARGGPIRGRKDLVAKDFLGYIDEMLFAPGLDYLGDVHPGIRPKFQASSIFSQLAAARNGLGVTVLPHYLGTRYPDLVPVLPGEVELTRSYWMTCHRDLRGAPRERAVIDFLMSAIDARRAMLKVGVGAAGQRTGQTMSSIGTATSTTIAESGSPSRE
jgi:DNA-binding transcriptional LysR family regulator